MSDETQRNHVHQFEQALATAFTCRSIIKYNSTLTEAQKTELLADIDSTVQFLQERLTANKAIEKNLLISHIQQQSALVPSFSWQEHEGEDSNNNELKLQMYALQQLYHYYFDTQSGQPGQPTHQTTTFHSRFNEVLAALDHIQLLCEQETHPFTRMTHILDHLHRVRSYITDMYTIFTEFTRSLTNALDGHDIYVDTEKQASLPSASAERVANNPDITPLLEVYETHQLLNQKMGSVTSRTGDATAFLIFLQDQLNETLHKREDIIPQLNAIAILLNDLRYLLADYERVVATVIHR